MLPGEQTPRISRRGDTLTLTYDRLNATDFTTREAVKLDMRLTLDITLEGDEVRFASKIENGQPHTIVRELHYPLVGGMPLPEDHKLLLTHTGGQLYDDPKGMIFRHSNASPYKTPAQKFRQMDAKYPMRTVTGGTGGCMASNCFAYVASARESISAATTRRSRTRGTACASTPTPKANSRGWNRDSTSSRTASPAKRGRATPTS